jgi:hypothetical protein
LNDLPKAKEGQGNQQSRSQSDHIDSKEDNRQSTKPEGRTKQANDRGHTPLEIIALVVAAIAALGTSWQAYISSDNEQRSLRAYLGVSFPPTLQCSDCDNPLYKTPERGAGPYMSSDVISLTIKSGGGTPAHDIHLRHLDWQPFPNNVPYTFGIPFEVHENFAEVIESRDYLLPSDTTYFKSGIIVETFRQAKLGSITLRIYGAVDYYDVFDKGWSKEFCFIYTSDIFSICPEHNGDHANYDQPGPRYKKVLK